MVARGDLGIEVPMEDLPLIQKRAIETCIRLRRLVIVATDLLESMITSPVPTRAGVTDIASAVASTSDAIMLSGETTTGKYPSGCVSMRACRCPVYAFTDDAQVFRHMLLLWGVEPFLMNFSADPETTIKDAFSCLSRRGWTRTGEWMVVVTNVLAGARSIDSIQMRAVE